MGKSTLVTVARCELTLSTGKQISGREYLVSGRGAKARTRDGEQISGQKHFGRKSLGCQHGRIVYVVSQDPAPCMIEIDVKPNSEFGKRENRFRFRIVLEGRRKPCSLRSGKYPKS